MQSRREKAPARSAKEQEEFEKNLALEAKQRELSSPWVGFYQSQQIGGELTSPLVGFRKAELNQEPVPYPIGDLCVLIAKTREDEKNIADRKFFLTKNGRKMDGTGVYIDEHTASAYLELMSIGPAALIEGLKEKQSTSSLYKNGIILEKEFLAAEKRKELEKESKDKKIVEQWVEFRKSTQPESQLTAQWVGFYQPQEEVEVEQRMRPTPGRM